MPSITRFRKEWKVMPHCVSLKLIMFTRQNRLLGTVDKVFIKSD